MNVILSYYWALKNSKQTLYNGNRAIISSSLPHQTFMSLIGTYRMGSDPLCCDVFLPPSTLLKGSKSIMCLIETIKLENIWSLILSLKVQWNNMLLFSWQSLRRLDQPITNQNIISNHNHIIGELHWLSLTIKRMNILSIVNHTLQSFFLLTIYL